MAVDSRVWLLFVVAMATFVAGCDLFEKDHELLNTCPRINHAGDAWWEDDGLHFGVWIQDLDGDSVDLFVDRSDGTEILTVQGHGSVGLSATVEYPGAPHELVVTEAALSDTNTLTLTPVDLEGCAGEPVTFDVP